MRRPHVVLPLIAACVLFTGSAVMAPAQNSLSIVDLDPGASGDVVTAAQIAFRSGKSVIRVHGRSGEEPKDLLGLAIGSASGIERQRKTDKNDNPVRPDHEGVLSLRGYAAYIKSNGQVRMVRSFAPAKDSSLGSPQWRDHLDEWIQREQQKAAQEVEDDPSPPAQAWTLLNSVTLQSTSYQGNFEQNTVEIYRLNSIEPASDYYMVYQVPETKPNYGPDQYGTYCDGFDYCGWHTISRDFTIQQPASGTLIDHGPTGTITTESASFSIGGSLDASGPGVSVGFSAGWSQPSVVTTDNSSGTNAQWNEQMTLSGVACDPVVGKVPPVSSGTYLSRQGVIYQVPGGTGQLTIPVKAHTSLCATFDFGHNWDDVTINQNIQVGPPLLGTSPTSLTIAAGTSAYLSVTALIPFSDNGLPWVISTNQSWLTVPTGGPFSSGQLIQVSVAGGTPLGSTGTISVNTSPPFAAPSVFQHPLQIPVTVGQPPTAETAGVLLIGGTTSSVSIQPTPEFYDAATKLLVPVGNMVTPRSGSTLTPLGTGKVLIAAGEVGFDPGYNPLVTGAAELFDPVSKSFTATGSLAEARTGHTATLLPDGKVLVVGGASLHSILNTAELFDPATGTFTAAGTMASPRVGHGAVLISGPGQPAKVLVFGGKINTSSSDATASSEIWEEATKAFTAGPNMMAGQMFFPQPAISPSGLLEFAGGFTSGYQATDADQILTVSGPAFMAGQSLNVQRNDHTLTRLLDGSLLATGGYNAHSWLASAEVRDTAAWTLLSSSATCTPGSSGCMSSVRYSHSATLLPDGTVFIAGGVNQDGTFLGSSEIYDPTTKSFTPGISGLKRAGQAALLIATTTTKLTAGSDSSVAGQSVDFVATVSGALGKPTGTVVFNDGATVLGRSPVNNSGQASLSTTSLPVGAHAITAAYEGDALFSGSASVAVTHTVTKIITQTGLTSSPNPSNSGQTVTLTAVITTSGPEASGEISFFDGTATLGTAGVKESKAELSVNSFAIGNHALKAVYGGDGTHEGSTSVVVTQIVSQRTTATQLQVAPASSSFGQEITLTSSVSGQGGTPTGTVTFIDEGKLLGSVPLAGGTAALRIATLPAGTHNLEAKYSGDPTFDGSTSSSTPHTVSQAASSVSIRSGENPSTLGQPVTFFASVTGPGITPTGSVTFYDGPNALGNPQPLINGSANLSTSALAVGPHQITASYTGDSNYISGASSPLTQEVRGTPTQTTLTSSANPSIYGQSITLSAAVNSGSGTVTGMVVFTDGTASLGSAPISNGLAVLNVSTLTVGSHSITSSYGGDGSHGASVSSPLSQVVDPASTQTAITTDQNPAITGATVTLKATVKSTGGIPTGMVGFYDGAQLIGNSPLTAGSGEFRISTLSTGAHAITARYSAAGNFAGSTSKPINQIISAPQPLPTTTSVTLDPDTVLSGESTAVSVTVRAPDGTAPNGKVRIVTTARGVLGTFPVVGGRATTDYLTTSSNIDTVTATYEGNAQFAQSSGSATLDVLPGRPTSDLH